MLSSRLALSGLFFIICASTARAEPRQSEQAWFQAVAQGPVSGDLVYFAELQPRRGKTSQLLARGGLGVKVAEGVMLYQGYANVRTAAEGRPETRENRAFQQLSWSLGKPGGIALSSRTRLEQRWLSSGDDTGWRLREMVRAAAPIASGGKVQLIGSVEVFVALNDTDWGARGGLDRVRSFAGLELPLVGKSTVEVGYLNQYVKAAAGPDQMDHVAAVNLMLRR